MRLIRHGFLTALVSLAFLGCGSDDDESATTDINQTIDEAVAHYPDLVHKSYEDALTGAEELDAAVEAFVADPSEETLTDAREAWLASREPYLQTEVYRFYDGPIDNTEDGPEGLINAWPLDEAYIDYVEDDETAGIVNDTDVEIDGETLEGLNEQGGEDNIATGYHAVEFLLWGQDRSDTGPGDRPYTDYVEGDDATAENAARRSLYLETVSGLISEHLSDMVAAWAPDSDDNYRAEFEALDRDEALTRILTGMIVLTGFETGGERLQTALDSGSQEDEHSCFSDNTHRDMVQDVRGIRNVWTGSYQDLEGNTLTGTGVRDVVRAKDAALADEIDAQIEESFAAAEALEPPFDQEIDQDNEEGNARVEELITSLRAQEKLFEDVFVAFDLTVPVPE
jgi:putative iron-regulated protein